MIQINEMRKRGTPKPLRTILDLENRLNATGVVQMGTELLESPQT